MGSKRLYRSRDNKMVAGVIGGLGEYFDVDPTILRLAWVLIDVMTGFLPGLIVYVLAAIIMPQAPV
ncbi:MAG: PspC domain-containing protein [Chloroflexi bacterium]|nr:PspC domain-containing protein [Chloroflexota bacterium]